MFRINCSSFGSQTHCLGFLTNVHYHSCLLIYSPKHLSPITCHIGGDIGLHVSSRPEGMPGEDKSRVSFVSPSTQYLLCLGDRGAINEFGIHFY